MNYLHSVNVYHRDIKLENLLVDNNVLKIIDFGFAIKSKEKLKVYCGTPQCMLPELVLKKEYNGADADLWATGIVMYRLLTGVLPFYSKDSKELGRLIVRGNYAPPTNAAGEMTSELSLNLLS